MQFYIVIIELNNGGNRSGCQRLTLAVFSRYYQAWELRQQGKKLREIGEIVGISKERVRFMTKYIDFLIKERPNRMSKELKELTGR